MAKSKARRSTHFRSGRAGVTKQEVHACRVEEMRVVSLAPEVL